MRCQGWNLGRLCVRQAPCSLVTPERIFLTHIFPSQGPGALCGGREPLSHFGPGLPHVAPAADPAPGCDCRPAAPLDFSQPRLPPAALQTGQRASRCQPELRAQVRAGAIGCLGQGMALLRGCSEVGVEADLPRPSLLLAQTPEPPERGAKPRTSSQASSLGLMLN